jgi:hypothetical protein
MPEQPEPVHAELTKRMIETVAAPVDDFPHPLVTDHRLAVLLERLAELRTRADDHQRLSSPLGRLKELASTIVKGRSIEAELAAVSNQQLIDALAQLDQRTRHQRQVIAGLEQRILRLESSLGEQGDE